MEIFGKLTRILVLTLFTATPMIICYSQSPVESILIEAAKIPYDSTLKFDLSQQLPIPVLVAFKKILPNAKRNPVMTKNEEVDWRKKNTTNGKIERINPRIISAIYNYKDYYQVSYYIDLGRYSVPRDSFNFMEK